MKVTTIRNEPIKKKQNKTTTKTKQQQQKETTTKHTKPQTNKQTQNQTSKEHPNNPKPLGYVEHMYIYIYIYPSSLHTREQQNLTEVLQLISKDKQLIFSVWQGQNEV